MTNKYNYKQQSYTNILLNTSAVMFNEEKSADDSNSCIDFVHFNYIFLN